MIGEITAQKHHRFDLVCWDRYIGSPVVTVFEVVGHNVKAVFKEAVDLQEELFIRIRIMNHQLRTNDLLQLNEDISFCLDRLRDEGGFIIALVFLLLSYHKAAFFPSDFE